MLNRQLQVWAKGNLIKLQRSHIAVLKPDALAEIAADFAP